MNFLAENTQLRTAVYISCTQGYDKDNLARKIAQLNATNKERNTTLLKEITVNSLKFLTNNPNSEIAVYADSDVISQLSWGNMTKILNKDGGKKINNYISRDNLERFRSPSQFDKKSFNNKKINFKKTTHYINSEVNCFVQFADFVSYYVGAIVKEVMVAQAIKNPAADFERRLNINSCLSTINHLSREVFFSLIENHHKLGNFYVNPAIKFIVK